MTRACVVLLVAMFLGLPFAHVARADGCHAIHGDTDLWTDPSGWSCMHVPTDNADLSSAEAGPSGGSEKVIPAGTSVSINDVTLDGGGIDLDGGSFEVGEQLVMKDGSRILVFPHEATDTTAASGASLDLDGDSDISDSNIVVGGDPSIPCAVTNTADMELDDGAGIAENTQGQALGTHAGSLINKGDITGDDVSGDGITLDVPVDNEGTVEAGTGGLSIPGPDTHASSVGGKWIADGGATLNFYANRSFDDGDISGDGTVETSANSITVPAAEGFSPGTLLVGAGVLTLAGPRTVDNLAVSSAGDAVLKAPNLTITDHLQLGNGQLASGTLHAAAGSTTTVSGTFTAIGTSVFHNAGMLQFRGGQLGASDARLINDKTGTYLLDQGGVQVQEMTSGGPIGSTGATFVNNGLIHDTYIGPSTFNIPVQLGGTVQVDAGTLVLGPQPSGVSADTGHIELTPAQAGLTPTAQFYGTRTMKAKEISGTGEVSVAGGGAHLTIPGPLDQPNLDLDASTGGDLSLTGGSFSFDRLSLETGTRDGKAPVNVQGLSSTGYSTIADGGTVTSKTSTNLLDGGLSVNADLTTNGQTTIGTDTQNGTSTIDMSGGQWTNAGSLSITAAGNAIQESTEGGPLGSTGAQFSNTGKLLIDPPAGSTASLEVDTINRGTILAERGTTSVAHLIGEGTIHALTGATFALDSGQTLDSSVYTTLITGGNIANPIDLDGTVQGPVLLDGAWTLNDPSITAVAIESGSTRTIQVAAGAALDGTLQITVPSGFSPAAGSTYTLIKATQGSTAVITGTFTAVTGLSNVTQPYQLVYTPAKVYLQF